jgi:hypothetical protein
MTCPECGAEKIGTIEFHKHGCSQLVPLGPVDEDPRIDQAEDERDYERDDYGWIEDSPDNPNVPER